MAENAGTGCKAPLLCTAQEQELSTAVLTFPSADMAEFICARITRAFRNEEFFVHMLDSDVPTYQIR